MAGNARALKLRAHLYNGKCTVELLKICKIKPFSLGVYTYGNWGRTGYGKAALLTVKNGGGNGAGIFLHEFNNSRLNIILRNGPVHNNSRLSVTRDSTTNYGYQSDKNNKVANGLYALREALELKFQNSPVDFEFEIIDNRELKHISHSCTARYLNKSYLQFKLTTGFKDPGRLSKMDGYIRTVVQSKDIINTEDSVIVRITNKNSNFATMIMANLGISCWMLPCIDHETQEVYYNRTQIQFEIKEETTTASTRLARRFFIQPKITRHGVLGAIKTPPWIGHTNGVTFAEECREEFAIDSPYMSMTNQRFFLYLRSPITKYIDYDVPQRPPGVGLNQNEHVTIRESFQKCFLYCAGLQTILSKYKQDNGSPSFDITFKIGNKIYTPKEFRDLEADSVTSDISLFKFESTSVNRIQTSGTIVVPEDSEDILEKFGKKEYEYLVGGEKRKFVIDINDEESYLNDEALGIKLVSGEPCSFVFDQKVTDANIKRGLIKTLLGDMCLLFGGRMIININEPISLELYPTDRCTPADFVVAVGAEYETGISAVNVAYATNGSKSDTGNVYGSCSDGGGIELQTVVMENPTVFSWVGKFDGLCKGVRNDPAWGPYQGSSTHFHVSINPAKRKPKTAGKKEKEINPTWYGEAMVRRTLIGNNWWSLFMKYTQALTFFDTFNPSSRRQTGYGKALVLKKNYSGERVLENPDSRFSTHWDKTYEQIFCGTGRECLLRTSSNSASDKKSIHWEWRGTDACPSALFSGLKVEFLVGIARLAIEKALEGKQLPLFDPKIKKEITAMNEVESIFDVTDVICREKAKEALEEIKKHISVEAYRGLKAWATHVEIVREDVGERGWFEQMEAILVQKIGVSNFLTNKELLEEFRAESGRKCFVPKKDPAKSKKLDEKKKKYREIIPSNYLDTRQASGYTIRSAPRAKQFQGYCFSCGNAGGVQTIKGLGLCPTCREAEPKLDESAKHGAEPFKPRMNASKKLKETIAEIVTKTLTVGDTNG